MSRELSAPGHGRPRRRTYIIMLLPANELREFLLLHVPPAIRHWNAWPPQGTSRSRLVATKPLHHGPREKAGTLPRETGDRCFTGCPQSGHKTRPSGSRLTAFSVQLRSAGGRSGQAVRRRSEPAQRSRRCVVFGVPSRQGRQGSHLSTLAFHNRYVEKPRRRAG